MICFGAKTDQEVKENVTCGSRFKKNKKNNNKIKIKREGNGERGRNRERERENNFIYLFFFSHFSLRYTEIGPSEFVGARTKRLYSTRATHGNQKHGISPSCQLKFEKSYVLVFLRSTAF